MKKIFLVLFAWLLMACMPLAPMDSSVASTTSREVLVISTSIPKDKRTPPPTWTYLIPASSTPTPTASPVATQHIVDTPLPLPTGPVCLTLSAPADGITFTKRKPVKFIWYAQRGAQNYVLLLAHQDGFQEKVIVPGTELVLDRRARPNDIAYQWMVMAYDANNQLICNSPIRTFTLYSESVAAASATPSSSP